MRIIPLRMMRIRTINRKINTLRRELQDLTLELYKATLTQKRRKQIDKREKEVLRELTELTGERTRRGRILAEQSGFVRPYAEFACYKENPDPIAYFSTKLGTQVTGETLHKQGRDVPQAPSYETWKQMVFSRKRCGFCWAEMDGTLAMVNEHVQDRHSATLK